MLTALNTALSGMRSAQTSLDVAAQNIATASTAGHRRQVAVPTAQPQGGVIVSIASQPQMSAGSLDGLTDDIVGQKVAGYAFQANLLVLETADRLQGSLLDTLA